MYNYELIEKEFMKVTPIEEYNNILFKRGDKLKPFDLDLNGQKLSEAFFLIKNNLEIIKEKFNSTIITSSSVKSPQSYIISLIGQIFNLKTIIFYGSKNKGVEHYFLKKSLECGSELKNVTTLAYERVLQSKINEYLKTNKGFLIKFGINNSDYEKNLFQGLKEEVSNIPNDVQNLVIPVGSGVTTKGIFSGLIEKCIKIPNIYCVQICGYDRTNVINDFLERKYGFALKKKENNDFIKIKTLFNEKFKYNFIKYKKYTYSRKLKKKLNENEMLDPVYEAKAFDWLENNIDFKNEKTLFWIIGNNTDKS